MINAKPTFAFLFTVVIMLLATTGCNKNDDNQPNGITFNGPWLKTETFTDPYGVVTDIKTYTYDASHRLTNIGHNDGTTEVFQYSATTVTNVYTEPGQSPSTTTHTLNSDGLATTYDGETRIYDADYRLTSRNDGAGNTSTYTYTNGNLTAEASSFSSGTNTSRISQYLTDKTNTTGYQNKGINFLGVQSTNLVSSESLTAGGFTSVTTFTYEYDSQGRVTKTTSHYGSGSTQVWDYTYY